jgi:hypothetical protein
MPLRDEDIAASLREYAIVLRHLRDTARTKEERRSYHEDLCAVEHVAALHEPKG